MKFIQVWHFCPAVLILAFSATQSIAGGDEKAGRIKFETCAGCHSKPGYSNAYPRYNVPKLAGQHAAYTVSALKAYSNNERSHPSMQGNAAGLSPQDFEDIAAYLASFELANNETEVSGDIGAGEEKAASCAGCHGEGGNSLDGNYPKLSAQYESYLVKVLQDYRSQKRTNPMMNAMVGALSDEDIDNIAAFYASQTKGIGVAER